MAAQPAAVRTPADLARDTIRQLALRRLSPTPENYGAVYHELSGEGPAPHPLKTDVSPLAMAMPASASAIVSDPGWGKLVRDLVQRWEARTPQWTQAQKRESLERLLSANAHDSGKLGTRLGALLRAWGEGPSAATAGSVVALAPAASAVSSAAAPAPGAERAQPAVSAASLGALRDLSVELLRLIVGEGEDDPALAAEAAELSARIAAAPHIAALADEAPALRRMVLKVELAGRTRREQLRGLSGLLALVVGNIEELVPDERWVKGQIARLRGTLSGPLSANTLTQAEAALREVIIKQGTLKKNLGEAEDAMKSMLADFLGRLGDISASTGHYSKRVEEYAGRIRTAGDLSAVSDVVRDLLADTRSVQADTARVQSELEEARTRALEQEARARRLEAELEEVSGLVCSDPLTGVLNRRGLADSTAMEFARARRDAAPLCLSVLDIDNFKKLNDSLGHSAGDAALTHLAAVLRETLRPTDVVARYGGEEFVILLPATGMEEAVGIMTRVQRALTRRLFLHETQQLLITFSAGVAAWDGSESERELVARADTAMYAAKQSGKNRVNAA